MAKWWELLLNVAFRPAFGASFGGGRAEGVFDGIFGAGAQAASSRHLERLSQAQATQQQNLYAQAQQGQAVLRELGPTTAFSNTYDWPPALAEYFNKPKVIDVQSKPEPEERRDPVALEEVRQLPEHAPSHEHPYEPVALESHEDFSHKLRER